jgi:hypothetical protein
MKIEATNKTPYVEYNESNGTLLISGKSIPENTIKFYQTIVEWLQAFIQENETKKLELIFKLEYFNTSSAKKILEVMKLVQQLYDKGNKQVSIQWQYEEGDVDMLEAGEDFMKLLHIPISFTAVEEE